MRKAVLLSSIPAMIALVLTMVFWGQLPAKIPIHWDFSGTPDRFAPKLYGMGIFLGMMFFLPVLLLGILKLDPRRRNVEDSSSAVSGILVGISFFLLALQGMVIRAALTPGMKLSTPMIMLFVGLLIAGLGVVMPGIRSNFFMGIRTPWTLDSEQVWIRTHRLARVTMLLGGGASVISGLAFPAAWSVGVSLGAILLGVLIPAIASYFFFQQEKVQNIG